ncbi:hypothetical protein Leryth_018113 [Lithospermum erythrorhizon]|nr:hypothetical protein Leryth_018113 [Lithospermum erythrorhizon]
MSLDMHLLLPVLTLGTAFSKCSEGLQMEYIAMFLAVIFPGALVAFNYEHLLSLPHIASLRIYCAGIWHNAVFSAACVVLLVLLPSILYPFYIHGESPMVLEVSSASPLFRNLSPGDLLISIDGVHVHDAQEWGGMITLLNERAFQNSNNLTDFVNSSKLDDKKGYCVPLSLIKGGTHIELEGNQNCPDELSAFTGIPCGNTRTLDDTNLERKYQKEGSSAHCFNANDIVKLNKCIDGRVKAQRDANNCQCSEAEFCMAPIEIPGSTWVEITYISSSSARCRSLAADPFSDYNKEDDSIESNCLNTFVFVGDVISMAESLYLTSYRPRWSLKFGMYIPNMVEKLLTCCFQVSTVLALLNSLRIFSRW